ncbi:DUF1697 domain-containing protein [Psychrobium sp. nBUS_13]|uniref:DUF1697 domain-containing protein n=1 Tax=Psychrobium sp. nBUS_13 TaxID=3395319 RepID=UPI003EB6E4A7
METYVVLFRGINVGGNNKVAMKPLVAALENAGFINVNYYIQSGNVVLDSDSSPLRLIAEVVKELCGISPAIMVIKASEFSDITASNPYKNKEGKLVHFFICNDIPELNLDKVAKYQLLCEQYTLKDRTLYLFAPDGIGRSKFATNMESCLGVSATARNLNTINKIVAMLD